MNEPLEQTDLTSVVDAANNARSKQRLERIQALAVWDATPKSQKKKLGLATTVQQFADQYSVHPNRIYDDRKSEEYARYKAQATETNARQIDPRGTAAISETKREALANDDLAVYEQLKGQLAEDAMAGDAKALENWMRLFGQPFIVEENKRVDDVANLDDRALAEEIVELVGAQILLDILKDRGKP